MDVEQQIKDLVIARLEALPENVEISIGSKDALNKTDLIRHVKDGDDLGRKIMEVEMNFLRSMKEGSFYESLRIGNEA